MLSWSKFKTEVVMTYWSYIDGSSAQCGCTDLPCLYLFLNMCNVLFLFLFASDLSFCTIKEIKNIQKKEFLFLTVKKIEFLLCSAAVFIHCK